MAGDWIKMRVWLAKDPKVIAIANFLSTHRPFIDWMTDPVLSSKRDSHAYVTRDCPVTCHVVSCVTVTGLLQVWGVTREDGHRDGDDLVVDCTDFSTVDEIAGFPGLGQALESVGWVIYDEENNLAVFPKFFQRNVSSDELKRSRNAERKRRQREKSHNVTRDNHVTVTRDCHADVTQMSRTEKEKEKENSKEISFPPKAPLFSDELPPELDTDSFRQTWSAWLTHRREIKKPLTKTSLQTQLHRLAEWGEARATSAIQYTIAQGWQGIREPDQPASRNGQHAKQHKPFPKIGGTG
jgi:hypothetical protein